MADLRFDKSRYRVNTARKRTGQVPLDKGEVAKRILARAKNLGLKQSEMAATLGVPKTTMGRIWKGENLPDSSILFPLSDLLGVPPRWLLYGGDAAAQAESPDGDWITLPLFDLSRISRKDKGEPVGSVPVNRDWLESRIRGAADLWLATMPNDLLADVAGEGQTIICSDIAPRESELADGRVYVLLLDDQPVIRRVSFEPEAILLSTSNERLPPIRVPRTGRADAPNSIYPIARVRGALLLNSL